MKEFPEVTVPKPTRREMWVSRLVRRNVFLWFAVFGTAANFVVAMLVPPSRYEELLLLALASIWAPLAIVSDRGFRRMLEAAEELLEVNCKLLDLVEAQRGEIGRRGDVIHLFRVREGMAPDQRPS